ncbi:MAG: sugar-binding protein [Candidatus Omnitrophota bacterium]
MFGNGTHYGFAVITSLVFLSAITASLHSATGANTLSGKVMTVNFSPATGQVDSISDSKGMKILSGNEDHYDLEGKKSLEGKDRVISGKVDAGKAVFECVNDELGLKITKEYQLEGDTLLKKIRYSSDRPEKLLLKVSSRSTIEDGLYEEGYYYIPIDDGSRVWTKPFIPTAEIKTPMPWPVDGGTGAIYYFPKKGKVFVHEYQKINGGYFYIGTFRLGDGANIECKLIPGGAITALGQAFVDRESPLTLEVKYLLLDGDPREYHQYVHSHSPYREYWNGKQPDWFRNSRMFLSDGPSGSGKGLMEDRDAVAKDVMSFLSLLPEDQYLMIFFNHWSTSGDYPYQGTFRYQTYTDAGWSKPVPVEKMKENIAWLKSLSPRIKVGGYVFFSPANGTYPYEKHKEWLLFDKNGDLLFSGDGLGSTGVADFTSGYADYSLDQMKHMITDTGFDWIHLDYGPFEAVNWKPRKVIQNWEAAIFYDRLAKMMEENNAVLVENGAPSSSLWAHGSYFEIGDPGRWEKMDWRILTVSGYLTALYRTNRPGTWVNNCYGTAGMHGLRNSFAGMTGWIRNGMNWWMDTPHSLAHEKVIDELLETSLADIVVHPSWWRFETDRFEAEAFKRGRGLIIPVLLHGDKSSEEKITFDSSGFGDKKGEYLFSFDLRLSPPNAIDVFRPVPWKEDYVELLDFTAAKSPGKDYTHRLKLEPMRNYYHLVTQVPAWVYTSNGQRTSLLLPENRGVIITGSLLAGSKSYRLQIDNKNNSAQVMAYVPKNWTGADVKINNEDCQPTLVSVLSEKGVLFDVPKGKSTVDISDSRKNVPGKMARIGYLNPQEDVWREASERVWYTNLEHRPFEERGKSCLVVKEIAPGGGQAVFPILGVTSATSGFCLKVKGEKSFSRIAVFLAAGSTFSYEITDDFIGWKEFRVSREQMAAVGKEAKWAKPGSITLRFSPVGGKEMTIADLCLLPARPGDEIKKDTAKRKITIYRTAKPPVIDGYGTDPCWNDCETITDFYELGGGISDSKTFVKVCYDDDNLYVFFNNVEPLEKLAAPLPRDTAIWSSDHVELFIDPYRDLTNWFQLLVDTGGTIEDLRYGATGRSEEWNGDFQVKTVLNWKASWMAEYKVPFKVVEKTPKDGDVWGFNFGRMDVAGEWSNWATNGAFLDPAGFGEVVFGGTHETVHGE